MRRASADSSSTSMDSTASDVASRIAAIHCSATTSTDVPAALDQLRLAVHTSLQHLQAPTTTDREREEWLDVLYTAFAGAKDERGDDAPHYHSTLFTQHGHTAPPSATLYTTPSSARPFAPSLPSPTGKKGKRQTPPVAFSVTGGRFEYRGVVAFTDRFDASSPSTLLIDLIDTFHDRGGYPTLLTLVSPHNAPSSPTSPHPHPTPPSAPPPPSLLSSAVRLLSFHCPHLQSAFSSGYCPPFIAQTLSSFSILTDAQLKGLTKPQIDTFYTSLTSITSSASLTQCLPSIHQSRLSLIHNLLLSDQFEKRIIAMSLLNEALDALRTKDDPTAIPSHTLHSFIAQTELITHLLSHSTSHAELLKRCIPLFSFAHSQHLLTTAHYALLASWLHSGHDHALHIVYGVLLELTSFLPISTCNALYKVMFDTLRPEALTTGMLRFFYHYSMKVLGKRAALLEERRGKVGERKEEDPLAAELRVVDGEWLGLTTWWSIFVHSYRDEQHPLPPAITSTAISLLQSMLRSPLCEPQRDYYAAACLPEHDTRVLTNHGFLFLSEIQGLIEAGQLVLYASYDTTSESIVYTPGELITDAAPPERWVDFTHAATRCLWDATSDDYGSTVAASGADANHLTLRTTPDHDMYVLPCMKSARKYYERTAGGAAISAHKITARELAAGYQCGCAVQGLTCAHGYSHYRMYTGAASGLRVPPDVISLTNRDRRSPAVALGLRSENELDAFLELFGYWLGDGTMHYDTRPGLSSQDAVRFSPTKQRDRGYLLRLLNRLHLKRGTHYTCSGESAFVFGVQITKRCWFRFFDDEFGIKYKNSPRYDKEQALIKQGMHSSQRRPRTPSLSTPSSTTRSPRESSACDRTSGDSSDAIDLTQDDDVKVDDVGAVVLLPSVSERSSSPRSTATTEPSVTPTSSGRSRALSSLSSSSELDLTRSLSVSFTFTPRGRSTSTSSTDSMADAIASSVASASEPRCLLCDGVEHLNGDAVSGVWYCSACVAAINDSAALSGAEWSDEEVKSIGSVSDAAMDDLSVKGEDEKPLIDDDVPMKDEESPPRSERPTPAPPADVPSEPEDDDGDPPEEEPPAEDEPSDSEDDEDEDDPVKSAKWLPDWVLFRLSARQLRLVIEGLRQADGHSAASAAQLESAAAGGNTMQGHHMICTSGVGFRDQLVHACLHAGYSAYFKLNRRAGEVRSYQAVPNDTTFYSLIEVEEALLIDPTRQFKAVKGKYDNYWVCYNEEVSHLLPARDVRFDGKACIVRQKIGYKKGWVAVHTDGCTVWWAAMQSELAVLISSTNKRISQARNTGQRAAGVWRIYTAAEYEEQQSGQAEPAAVMVTEPADAYDKRRDGRVWCVQLKQVKHDDRLIFVQRVHRNTQGVVTKVGRTMVVGNCVENVQQGRAASTNLQVLTSIIQSFPPMMGRKIDPQWHGSQAEYVVWLETRWHLVDTVIQAMVTDGVRDSRGLNGMRGLALALPSMSPSVAGHFAYPQSPSSTSLASSTSFSSSPPGLSHLQLHFNFLETFLRLSTLTLSLVQARRLWSDHFLHPTSLPSSHSATLRFFSSLLSHRSKAKQGISVCIDDAVCLFFLQDCLCRLPLDSFTPPTFASFEVYFLAVNSQQTLLSSPSPSTMLVNSYALHGLDELWSLAMTARDNTVRDDAARLLLRIYHARSNIAQVGAEGFIKAVIQYMNSPVQPSASFSAAQVYSPTTPHTPSASPRPPPDEEEPPLTPLSATQEAHEDAAMPSPSNGAVDWEDENVRKERTARCLRLLQAFIKGPKVTPTIASGGVESKESGDMQVMLQLKPPGTMKHVLTLPAITTVAALRQAASPLFSHPPSYIDLIGTATSAYSNKLIPDAVTLLTIPSNPQVRTVTVTVARRPVPEDIRATIHVSIDSPASLLAQSLKHYEKLYSLMAPRNSVALARPAFELLQLLPANQSLFGAVLGLSMKWKRLLPAQAPLQLLHTLGVVSDIITKQPFEGDMTGVKRDSWLTNFIETDGLLHLREVMMRGMGPDANASGVWMRAMRVKALGVLMSMLIQMAKVNSKAREVVCEKAKHAAIAQRVLEVIADTTLGMAATDASSRDGRFVSDCCVPTLHASFAYLELLLSTPNRVEENAAVWTQLYSSSFSHVFLHTLLESPFTDVRRAISVDVRTLTEQHPAPPLPNQPNPLIFFTNLLLSSLSSLSTSSRSSLQTGEFFSLLSTWFRSPQLKGSSLLQQGRGEQVVQTLISLIDTHPSTETTKQVSDDSLRALLAFTAVLFHSDPALKEAAGAHLVRLLYGDCLFAIDESRAVLQAKAKHHDTRTQAYQTLLATVLRCQPNMEELLQLTFNAHNAVRKRTKRVWELESEGLKGSYVGLRNLGNTCLPECDARVLTDSGFLFLSDIEARIDAGQRVLYACYDTSTQSIVYRPGQVVLSAPPTRWVDFTQAGTRSLWDATSDDFGTTVAASGADANHLTLRTTPDHDMYVQLCTRCEKDGHEVFDPRLTSRAPIPPHKQPALQLSPGYACSCAATGRPCTHGYSHYRMYTGAAAGLHAPADRISLTDSDPRSPVAALGLRSADELHAFLKLFGCWLVDGSMSYSTCAGHSDAVTFSLKKQPDCVHLGALLVRLQLVRGVHFTSSETDLCFTVRITEPRWFRFFDEEFGLRYRDSRHYNRLAAVAKQGNTVRRSSLSVTASTVQRPSSSTPSSRSRAVSSASAEMDVEGREEMEVSEDVITMSTGEETPTEKESPSSDDGDDEPELSTIKWLPHWVLFRLDAAQLRLLIEGLRQAGGHSAASAAQLQSAATGGSALQGENTICTSGVTFRDQLIHACLHAGYSAYFTLNTLAGEVRGYHAVPKDDCIYTEEGKEAALRVYPTRQFTAARGRYDSWWVCYSEAVSELLPAQDVRFDGGDCRTRQMSARQQGQASQSVAPIPTQAADLYDKERDGRVWCVSVEHGDRLIFVQRAHRNAARVVTKVGRSVITGNCYFAAVIQQLVMVPGLNEAFLSLQAVKEPEKGEGATAGLEGDQLFDFQSLLLPLVLSSAASIDPSSFISRFSFFGEPVNPQVQMDSQEFLSVFFDRLTTSLSRTSNPALLSSFFGGQLSNEISSLSCSHRLTRAEEFFMLSLSVQHHRDIRTSLTEFFKGEVLAGANAWLCGECKEKVDAEKRSVITELPSLLILHLKRFEFDFDVMRKKKLNDECAFPLVLNMQPYVRPTDDEALPSTSATDDAAPTPTAAQGTDNGEASTGEKGTVEGAGVGDEFLYDLVGVVIHSGHAEGGHYWSLIKDRFSPASSSSSTAALTPWLCFNDQKVSPFFIDDLAAEAFGGMEEVSVDVSARKEKNGPQMEQIQVEKQRSAYLLLYAKRSAAAQEVQAHDEGKEEVKGLQRSVTPFHEYPSQLSTSSLPSYLHELYQSIQLSNLQLLRDQLALDPPYSLFMLRCFLHAYDAMKKNDSYPVQGKLHLTYSLQMVQSLAMFTLNVMTRARNSKRLEQFIALIQHMIAMHAPACYWLLERFIADDQRLLRQCLLEATVTSRRLTVALLDLALAKLVRWEMDAEYQDKFVLISIADRDKEKAAAESEVDQLPSPATSAPPSTASTPANSAPSSASNSPVLGPTIAAPPVPPRQMAVGAAAAPALPPRPLPTVDATLAPDNMFKVKSAVSLASPLTVLHGIGAPSAKALTNAGIGSILQLAQVKDRAKKDYNALLSTSKLSAKQVNEAVDKARQAVQFIRQIGGDEQAVVSSKPPSPSPSPAPDASPAPQQNGSAQPSPAKKVDFPGLTEHSVLPRFISACVWLLQSIVSVGNEGSAQSMEVVDLCTRFARRGPTCARLLIERGAIDALIALYLGQSSSDLNPREASQLDSANSAGTDGAGADSRSNSFSANSGGLSLDNLIAVPPLPPLPELQPTTSSPSAWLPSPGVLSPAVSSVRVADKPHQLDYDQSAILILLTLLVKYCRMPHWPDNNPAPTFVPSAAPQPILPPHTRAVLTSDDFLSRLAHQPTIKSNTTQTDLATHLSWLDLTTSLRLLHHLLACVHSCEATAAWPALCQLQGLLTMGDDESLLTQRIHASLPIYLSHLQAHQSYYKLTDLCLRFLLTLQQAQPLLATYLHGRIEELSWLPQWLSLTKKPPTRSQPIFCDNGRVIQLYRDMDYKETKDTDPWTFPLGDLLKVYKGLVEEAKKRREAGIGRGDVIVHHHREGSTSRLNSTAASAKS